MYNQPAAFMNIHSGYATINGAELYYETAGQVPNVVFIHGFSLDHRMWDDQFLLFAKRFRVTRYDARGFGKSSLPTDNYSHHSDLKDLLDHIGITKAHFIGLSMGGRVATDFAIAYPGMVSSLVLVDSVLHGYINKHYSITEIAEAAISKGAKAANEMWLHSEIFAPAMHNVQVAGRLAGIIGDYSGWHWVNKNPWLPLEPASVKQLPGIKARTLVIAGEQDLKDFREIADILAQNIPGAIKTDIPGAGHMCNMEAPVVFNELVLGFLSKM